MIDGQVTLYDLYNIAWEMSGFVNIDIPHTSIYIKENEIEFEYIVDKVAEAKLIISQHEDGYLTEYDFGEDLLRLAQHDRSTKITIPI